MTNSHALWQARARRVGCAGAIFTSLLGLGAAPAFAGNPIFGDVEALGPGPGYAQSPAVSVASNGKTAVVWRDNNAEQVLWRSIDADGTPGATTTLSPGTGYLNAPNVSRAQNDSVAVAWEQFTFGSFARTSQLATIAADGTVRPAIELGSGGARPVVGLQADGTGWVAWVQDLGGDDRIVAARLAADGTLGPATPVSAAGSNADYPKIAVAADGRAWLAWIDDSSDTVRAAYAGAGGTFGAPAEIAATDPEDEIALAIDASGNGALVFGDDPDDLEYAPMFVRLHAGGAVDAPILIEEVEDELTPSIAMRSDGSGIASWRDDNEVHTVLFEGTGDLGPVDVASDPAFGLQRDNAPVIAQDGGRTAVAWWQDARNSGGIIDAKMRFYSRSGQRSAMEDVSGTLPADTPASGEIAFGYAPSGNFYAVWTARPGSNATTQIYGRVGYAPAANVTAPTAGSVAPVPGQAVTGDRGTWSGTGPLDYAYQWLRCTSPTDASSCVPIAGATALVHQATGEDEGAYLRLQVTASNIAEPDGVTVFSAASAKVQRVVLTPTPTATPVVSTPTPAAVVTAPPATVAPAPAAAPVIDTCGKSRVVKLTWKAPKGVELRSITVAVDGKTTDRLGGKARTSTVDLTATRPTLFKVVITAKARGGKQYQSRRDYRLCNPDVPFRPAGTLTLARVKTK